MTGSTRVRIDSAPPGEAQPRRRLVNAEDGVRAGPMCFAARGFSLHAATRIAAADTLSYTLEDPLVGRMRSASS